MFHVFMVVICQRIDNEIKKMGCFQYLCHHTGGAIHEKPEVFLTGFMSDRKSVQV